MTTEIIETDTNRYMRILIKSVYLFSLFFGVIFFILCVLFKQYIIGAIVALMVAFLYKLIKNNKVVEINLIKDNSLILRDGKKVIELQKEDISHVSKFVRFTATKHFLLSIVVRRGNFFTAKRYLLLNDPRNNLIDIFRNMNIELKNVS